ncbi:unnamed protein product [Miscanthus lutarioriparius]|uniref:Transducin/WD40 repeat-like superfamily protein n=1 Tax=Miscanthus lutarioriparius TaxID=422564 RepID=A0A811QBC5_9POAL|nr:unnamed protein product [Miscanthus lutarioriparius]
MAAEGKLAAARARSRFSLVLFSRNRYDCREPVPFSGGRRFETRDSSYYYEDRIWGARTAKFIAREKWIVVGSDWGFIEVYSYIAMRNFKGLKSYLFSEIKKFQAHEHASDISLDVHPTGPFLLSASSSRRHSSRWTVLGTIKLWDWENGWVCIRTFDTQIDLSQVKFNPMDPNRFVTVSSTGDAKVWNISSPSWESTLSGAKDAEYFDFFTRDDKLHLIISHYSKKKATSSKKLPTHYEVETQKRTRTEDVSLQRSKA